MENKEFKRGYNGAKECIKRGSDAQELLNQARSDLHQNSFTQGWKKACHEELEGRNKIVYAYNWNDLILITRDAAGNWFYECTPSKVMQHLNKSRRKKGEKTLGLNVGDGFTTGVHCGYVVNSLTRRCQISYGDTPNDELSTVIKIN